MTEQNTPKILNLSHHRFFHRSLNNFISLERYSFRLLISKYLQYFYRSTRLVRRCYE